MVMKCSGWWVLTSVVAVNLEILYLQDVTASFEPDWELIGDQLPVALKSIEAAFPNTRFGLATFADKPLMPFGGAVVSSGGEHLEVEDYCFRLRYPLSFNTSNIEQALSKITIRNGGDAPDCQLTALAESTSQAIRWSEGSEYARSHSEIRKLIIMTTDGPFHEAGELYAAYPEEAQPYFRRDQAPQAAPEVIHHVEDMLDYPSVHQVRDLLADKDITPIFLVKKDAMQYYASTFSDGYVFGLDEDSSNLGELIETALNTVLTADKFGCIGADCPDLADEEDAKDDQFVHFDHIPATLQIEVNGTGLDDEFTMDDFMVKEAQDAAEDAYDMPAADLEPHPQNESAADAHPRDALEFLARIGDSVDKAEILKEAAYRGDDDDGMKVIKVDHLRKRADSGKHMIVEEAYEDQVQAHTGPTAGRYYIEEGSDAKKLHRKNATNYDLEDLNVEYSA